MKLLRVCLILFDRRIMDRKKKAHVLRRVKVFFFWPPDVVILMRIEPCDETGAILYGSAHASGEMISSVEQPLVP